MNPSPRPLVVDLTPGGDGSVRVRVRGELDLSTSAELDEALEREIAGGRSVLVDLSGVTFIDSTGLNTLISALRSSEANGGALMVSSDLPAQVRRVFEITGLTGVLPIASDPA